MPALLAPTEKLCEGAAPNDRLRVRPPGWMLAGEGPYWKLDVEEEAVRGEEGTLRDEKESAMKYTGQRKASIQWTVTTLENGPSFL